MADNKYGMFYANIYGGNFTSSVYDGWNQDLLANLTSSERTIYYDSNIAFTSGDKSIVSTTNGDGSLLAVPDLYGTLKGLNDRISSISTTTGGGEISTADNHLYVTNINNTEHIISPGNGGEDVATGVNEDASISLQARSSTSKFTVNGDDFTFTVNNKNYTLTDIIGMIEELRARTEMFRTNIPRNPINLSSNNKYTLDKNIIKEA